MSANTIIVNIARLKADSYLDSNIDNNSIRVAVLFMQDEIIEHVIGTELFDTIKHMVGSGDIDCCKNSIYKDLVDNYLFQIFVWGVQAELSIPKSYKLRNAGLVQQNGDGVQQSSLDDIKYTNAYYRNKTNFYIDRAIKFLKCNKECFPELCSCSCKWCVDEPFSKKPLNTSLNLRIIDVKKRIR